MDNWKALPIDKYDGTTDPDEHLDVFLTQVTLSTTDDAALCRIFPTSLKGRALSWFTRLPPNSIDSFNTLSSQFTIQFATSRPHSLTSLSLVSLRQDKKESLRAFMDRFNKATLEIRDLNPAVALHHLTTALKPDPFVNSICKKPRSYMNDLRRRADKYMQMEELTEFRNQARAEQSTKSEKPVEQSYRGRGKEISLRERPIRGPKYTQYTPLNANRAAVLEQALASEVLTIPKRASTPPRADTSESCRYHRNHGHSTDECAALKDKIEDLIKQGKLHNFVDRSGSSQNRSYQPRYQDRHRQDRYDKTSDRVRRERSRSRERKDDSAPSHRRVINTIAGGFAGGGTTSSAQKRHLRAIRSVNTVHRQSSRRLPAITFTDADFKGIDPEQDDPMVISVEIHNCIVKKTLIDQGSSADIIYWNTFKQLGISEKELLPYDDPLVGFAGERVSTKGYIKLFTRFCFDEQESREVQVKYIVVDASTSYNILLGRPSLNALGAIVSTPHLAMKFPSDQGKVITIHADQKAARECYYASLRVLPLEERKSKSNRIHAVNASATVDETIWDLDPRMNNEERVEPIEPKVQFQIGSYPEQVTYIGAEISEDDRLALCKVIKENKDLFAWTPSDMPGVDPKIMCHKLSVCAEAKPIAQRKRKMGTERKLAVETEVAKLLEAGFIREVHYTTWLANVVMVKKSNGKWRMCTDYTSLNKECPKDAYTLPNIDRLVDGASGHEMLTFLDAYSGYNQIPMHARDEEKTAFITDSANYCYRVMPFGLKNAGATYQRLMNKVFQHQIGKNVEVYVDDMVVKSRNVDRHVMDLSEIFQQLRKYEMRLNPEKCVFGVSGGKFLGFMLSFEWSDECEKAFQTLKERLGSPPVLSKPDPEVPIVVYLCVSNDTISTVLIQEKEGQQPIYFVSRMLQEAETSVVAAECLVVEGSVRTWITEIMDYLEHGTLPSHPTAAKKLRTQAARYVVIGGDLYRRGFSAPLLKCVEAEQANYILREMHEGICGFHSGGRTLATKVLRAGYYWPTLREDCVKFVKHCVSCQRHDQELSRILGNQKWFKNTRDEELLEVLWAYRCTPQSTTKETPFRLTYGTDAMVPVEVGEPSFRRQYFQENTNDISLRAEVDMVDEVRVRAEIIAEACKQRMTRRFNSNLIKRSFKEGDLVWRVQGTTRRNSKEGKLAANWDGPFRVRHSLENGAYKLEELSGKIIPRTWNASHLKTYYS
uniref:Transposon Ty3-G Gag-Pol polyprotein n=1 Tax=Cajanus cajan TaxID=3821 RepID=A0A151RYL7_CAJCA|nr:Transposon Ty3-G Gag-Pol polyprotein [Cajanus cajan]